MSGEQTNGSRTPLAGRRYFQEESGKIAEYVSALRLLSYVKNARGPALPNRLFR